MIRVIPFSSQYAAETVYLLLKNKAKFSDDYHKLNNEDDVIKLVEQNKVNLFIALDDTKFIGCFYAYNFYADNETKKIHSCHFNGAAMRGVSSIKTVEAFDVYINLLYNLYGVVKIKANVAIDNSGKFRKKHKNCNTRVYINPATRILEKLRFKREGFLKGETMKDGKLVDFIVYGRINYKYLRKAD